MLINFDNCRQNNNKFYGGNAGQKLEIDFYNEVWFLKFPKSTKGMKDNIRSYTAAPLSEYIGSNIYEQIGIPVHKTLLGKKDDKIVVACKNFKKPGDELIEFIKLKNQYFPEIAEVINSDSSGNGTDFITVCSIVARNPFLQSIDGLHDRFWDMFVVDEFINNNDRNNENWGILQNGDKFSLAPVYDNGNSFNNKSKDETYLKFLSNESDFRKRVVNDARSIYLSGDKKNINPAQYILQGSNPKCNEAVLRIVPKINMKDILDIIDEIPEECEGLPVITPIYKEYIKKYLTLNKELVLDRAYEQLLNKDKNIMQKGPPAFKKELNSARSRLETTTTSSRERPVKIIQEK